MKRVAALLRILTEHSDSAPLDEAALELARIEHPGLPIAPFLDLLDSHARELGERVRPETGGQDFVAAANEYLFEELGFQGDRENYYTAANSCLNDVLLNRTGIPITLSIVYTEIARRLGRPVYGVSLPGHFLVRYAGPDYDAFIDAFNGGRLLDEEGCAALAYEVSGVEIAANPGILNPAPKHAILMRMLNNLRNVYLREENYRGQIGVLDLMLAARPLAAEQYKHRAVCHLAEKHYDSALRDFRTYLELAPEAADRAAVAEQAERIERYLAALY